MNKKPNISYVKPCIVKAHKPNGSEVDSASPKVENTKTLSKKLTVKNVRRELKKSISQPSLTLRAHDQPKPFVKTSSFLCDKSKPVSCLKMPNFALIHNKNFDKMESVFDHAKRKAERAKNLMTPKSEQKVTSLVKKTPFASKKVENITIFDFRGQKNEVQSRHEKHIDMAKKIVKKADECSTKRQQILKGVRLNKRFDLQLQYRQGL